MENSQAWMNVCMQRGPIMDIFVDGVLEELLLRFNQEGFL